MIINMNGAKAPETPSPVLQEKTITPETLPTVVGADEGYTGLSQVTVNPDTNLKAENIRSGKTIFGVNGTFAGVNTGDALSNVDLISMITTNYQIETCYISPVTDKKLTYTSDAEPDTSSRFNMASGLFYHSHAMITSLFTPLDIKLSYGVVVSDVTKYSETQVVTSNFFTGKVTGSFTREYTGSPIYTGSILELLRFSGMEFGIYEYNMHIKGYFTILDSPYGANAYIEASAGFPIEFDGDVTIKYRHDNLSTNSGVIEIKGFPDVTLENVTVGAKYSQNTSYYLVFIVKEMYFNALPTKVE